MLLILKNYKPFLFAKVSFSYNTNLKRTVYSLHFYLIWENKFPAEKHGRPNEAEMAILLVLTNEFTF